MDASQLASKFPSLKPILESQDSPILALYFASAWCDDCQASTPFVQEVVSKHNGILDLVYVSSDMDGQEMAGNLASSDWKSIPFQQQEERSNLKRHFGACASKETEGLGMKTEDRKSGIPTLLLLEKSTGNVLTRDAVSDIMGDTKVEDPYSKWKSMLSS
jgi:thiol-disulfide isomerase/thioredoxin